MKKAKRIKMKFKTKTAILLLAILILFISFDLFSSSSVENIVKISKKGCCNIIRKIKVVEQKLNSLTNVKWIKEVTLKVLERIGEKRTSTSEDKNGDGSKN